MSPIIRSNDCTIWGAHNECFIVGTPNGACIIGTLNGMGMDLEVDVIWSSLEGLVLRV